MGHLDEEQAVFNEKCVLFRVKSFSRPKDI